MQSLYTSQQYNPEYNSTVKYREKGDILIMGHLNSRTGREGNMYHENNKYIAEIAPENNKKTS